MPQYNVFMGGELMENIECSNVDAVIKYLERYRPLLATDVVWHCNEDGVWGCIIVFKGLITFTEDIMT